MQIIEPEKEQFLHIHRIGKRSCKLMRLHFFRISDSTLYKTT